jgi:signal transduction histidine kinase
MRHRRHRQRHQAEDLARALPALTTPTKVSGHGIGLMIVQRILRDHGGHVGIESKEGVARS